MCASLKIEFITVLIQSAISVLIFNFKKNLLIFYKVYSNVTKQSFSTTFYGIMNVMAFN